MSDQDGAFRDWTAILNLQPIVSPEPLRVRGDYFLKMRCGGVGLKPGLPGINERILILDIVGEGEGDGGWETAEARFPAKEGQYDSIQVRGLDDESITIDIEVVH